MEFSTVRKESLVVSSLDIGRALAARSALQFKASGMCMYPCIKPGDLLHISVRSVSEAGIGDVAVFRHGGSLIGHRVIGKGEDDRGCYILTRPDGSDDGDDGPTYDLDLLGIVSAIDRKGRIISPMRSVRGANTHASRLAKVCSRRLGDFRSELMRISARLLFMVQHSAVYKRAAGMALKACRVQVSYSILHPFYGGRFGDVYKEHSIESFIKLHNAPSDGDIIDEWKISVLLGGDRKKAVSMTFVLLPQECSFGGWWVGDVKTRLPYRGAGLENALMQKAGEIFRELGVCAVSASLSSADISMEGLFRDMGFVEVFRQGICSLDQSHRLNSSILEKWLDCGGLR